MEETGTLLFAYVIGSVPTTWLIYYWRTGRDLRRVGDRNVGSGNALRQGGGWFWGHVALLLDIGKGLLAISLARWLNLDLGWWLAAGYLAIAGHLFPVWLHFKGGRGAATALGAAGAFLPWQFGLSFCAGMMVFLLFRAASIGIALVAVPLPFLAIVFGRPDAVIAFCFSAPFIACLKTVYDSRRISPDRSLPVPHSPRGTEGTA